MHNLRGTPTVPMKTYYEGTVVRITMVISKPTATCTITIVDETEIPKIDNIVMTKAADYVYVYNYQSIPSDIEGEWTVTLKATYESYTAVTQDVIHFEEQES